MNFQGSIRIIFASILAASALVACSGGGSGGPAAAPALPPLATTAMDQYGGKTFTYTSPDQSCTSSVELFDADNGQMTVQDSGPCAVLYKETFTLNCTTNNICSGRIAKYAATISLSLDSPTSITFTRKNDSESSSHVTIYQLAQ